tara:strand:+ start:19763 stop:20548 length:786 start_codon:yes stop_codon:yes gene_type:complete
MGGDTIISVVIGNSRTQIYLLPSILLLLIESNSNIIKTHVMNSHPSTNPNAWSPLPPPLEEFAFRIVFPIIFINLIGTAFGFWYYLPQLSTEPYIMWPFVPDSPMATLFFALSLGLWKMGKNSIWISSIAFIGCIKLGLWTPYVLLIFFSDFSYLHPLMYHFLFWSHLAMVLQAFLIFRYTSFTLASILVGFSWHIFNDVVDYFIPIFGSPHHTWLPSEIVGGAISHTVPAHDLAAIGAIILTFISLALLIVSFFITSTKS